VTPTGLIDAALAIAARPGVIFCSFGDMLRVPATGGDLLGVQAAGGDVRMIYSPLDCLRIAREHPDREVVFFAVGFETTAPANALAIERAHREGLTNFSALVSHVLVPPAMEAVLAAPDNRVQAFLAAGHVCTVMGYREYHAIATRYRVPIVVTGFEPVDILEGLLMTVRQLEDGRAEVENQYARSVREVGNRPAQELVERVFLPVSRAWRGMGTIPASGLALRPPYDAHDAARRFAISGDEAGPAGECISGEILRGAAKPAQCPAFAGRCTPEHPLGPTMVSEEGACSAYYRYRRPDALAAEVAGGR